MKIKTSELTGTSLDWAVAKCECPDLALGHFKAMHSNYQYDDGTFDYSTDWAQGGPIIEREKIKIAPNLGGTWHGQIRHTSTHPLVAHPVLSGWTNKHGPTPLISAMRCYVASKLGEEVDVPYELKEAS